MRLWARCAERARRCIGCRWGRTTTRPNAAATTPIRGGPRKRRDAPDGAAAGRRAAAEPGPIQDNPTLERRVARLEAANAALRAEAERARLVVEGATDYVIITLDQEGRVTDWNEGARRILGHEDAEILGRPGEAWFPPEDRAAGVLAAEMRRALERGRAENERWHLRKDGTRFWASGLLMPLQETAGGGRGASSTSCATARRPGWRRSAGRCCGPS